jgi:hypothetical protein
MTMATPESLISPDLTSSTLSLFREQRRRKIIIVASTMIISLFLIIFLTMLIFGEDSTPTAPPPSPGPYSASWLDDQLLHHTTPVTGTIVSASCQAAATLTDGTGSYLCEVQNSALGTIWYGVTVSHGGHWTVTYA